MSHDVSQFLACQTVRPPLGRLLCLIALLTTPAFAQPAGPEFPNPGNAHMSRENQQALGLQAAAQVYQQMPVLPDSSPETQYIRQLGQKLVATIPPEHTWPYEFHVVAQKEINAFALPGGQMFVNIGTITAASNEAELAGVMAHEMSHVYMQHSAKQAYKDEWTQNLAGLAGVVAGATIGGTGGQLAQMGIQMSEQGLVLKYSRTDEAQADAVGAIILYKSGYNPQALADFFKTLETQGGPAPPQLLSDHPNPGNREQAIEKEIHNWPPENYAGDSPAFQKVRKQAMGVKAYTAEEIAQGAKSGEWAALNKKNGATFAPTSANPANTGAPAFTSSGPATASPVSLQSILPSHRMVMADLGPVKLDHPDNWQVMMPKQQEAPPNGQPMSIDDMTRQLVQYFQQNNGLKAVGDAQPITVGGVQGRSVNLQSTSPFPAANGQPEKERDWLVTVPMRDGGVIFLIFVAPQSEFARFQPTYEAMLKSVRF